MPVLLVIDIPGIRIWTITNACNVSYILLHRYTWDNKSVLLPYCSDAYNHFNYTYTKCKIKSEQTSI